MNVQFPNHRMTERLRHCVVGALILVAWIPVMAATKKAPMSKEEKKQAFIFYPPAPQTPRLQYLASYSSEADFGVESSKFSRFLIGKEPPKKAIVKPYGLAFHRGKLFVCDTPARGLEMLDFENRKFSLYEPQGGPRFMTPINITIDQDGTRYIADRGHNQVLIYGANDAYLGAIGERSDAIKHGAWSVTATNQPGATATTKEMWPTDVAASKDRLYVTDLNNNCVRAYEKANRQWLFNIPRDPKDENTKLFAPSNLALDTQGQLYVSDIGGFFVKKFDADGKYLQKFGTSGDRPGEFARPKGIAVDREGRLYVVDAASQVIQIFNPEGRLLLFFGDPKGSSVPLDLPAKVIIDYDHVSLFQPQAAPGFILEYLVIASNQYGNRKISVYGFGHPK